ncbi:hypothetical protein Lfu02_22740 [Longispora fulva]|uniref:Carbohydrate-binding module family 96 domain-containing protein n=1 Tax=Longispora fulva TaxID=619741 RepID=A0A8J7KLS6_9ACTN|nr:DNRLRE domain-containing protein [Longispora fulva]MBG6139714.1 hypothetical protein [Longispora fulva]GIG57902.1 hypothetical protein Lfu02_22740 [Longispora fulva]
MSDDGRPCPDSTGTPEEFVRALRRLKEWHGRSFRELEKRAAVSGDILPRATLTTALGRSTLPREEIVAAFVRACSEDEEDVRRWAGARRRLAAGGPIADTTPWGVLVPHSPTGPDADTVPLGGALQHETAAARGGPEVGEVAGSVDPADPATPVIPPELAAGVLTVAWRRTSFPVRVMTALMLVLVMTVTVGAVVRAVRDLGGPSQAMSQEGGGADTPAYEPSPEGSAPPGGAGGSGSTDGGGTGGDPGGSPGSGPSDSSGDGTSGTGGPGTGTSGTGTSDTGTPGPPATPGRSPADQAVTATYAATDDTTIWRGFPDSTQFGGQDDASTCGDPCVQTSNPALQRQVLVRFEVAGVPAGRCASSVELRLWAKHVSGGLRVHRLAAAWSEGSATWNNRPARGAELTRSWTGGGSGWIVFTLPAGPVSNGGHAYELEGLSSQTAGFGTRESGQAAQLMITHGRCG